MLYVNTISINNLAQVMQRTKMVTLVIRMNKTNFWGKAKE